MTRIWNSMAVALILATGGCASIATDRPAMPIVVPEAFTAEEADAAWAARITSPELGVLIDEVWRNNPNLGALAARVTQARHDARIAGSVRFPQLSAGAEASAQEAYVPFLAQRQREERYALSGALSWEVDLWGRLRDSRAAAAAFYEATVEEYAAAQLALAGAAASLWYDIAEAEAQVRLASRTLESFRINQRIVEQRYDAGLESALELRLSRANTATAQNAYAMRRRQRDAYSRALENLLGRYPAGQIEASSVLPDNPEPVAAGLPSRLLERRPDIRAAGARYESTVHGQAAARKARLPALRLTASGGLSSDELTDALRSENLFWNLVSGLTVPVLDGGRLKAEARRADSRREEAAFAYADVVLRAFLEVETALSAESYFREQQQALDVATENATLAERNAVDRYERGLIPYTALLDAQRRAFETESLRLSVRAQRLKNHVDLILALGGDFISSEALAASEPFSNPQ